MAAKLVYPPEYEDCTDSPNTSSYTSRTGGLPKAHPVLVWNLSPATPEKAR